MQINKGIYHDLLEQIQHTGVDVYSIEDFYKFSFSAFMISDYSRAMELVEKWRMLYPNDISLYDIEILCLWERWDFEKAKAICNTYTLKSLSSYIVRSHIELYSWNPQQALETLFEGVWIYPDNFVFEYNIWNIYHVLWEYDTALEYYDASIRHGNYLYAYSKKIKILKKNKDKTAYDTCLHELRSELEKDDIWDAPLIEGNIYFEEENFSQALICFKQYLERRENDFYTLDAIGNCLYHMWKYDEARMYYEKATEINNKISYPLNGLSKCFFSKKDYKTSLTYCEASISANPYNFEAYFMAWRNYYAIEQYGKAITFFQRALKLQWHHHMCLRYYKKTLQKLWILSQFIWDDNLEFVLSNTDTELSKILYRSFWDISIFKKNILNFITNNGLLDSSSQVILRGVFTHPSLQDIAFHFWVDTHTSRYKFYIPLYHLDIKSALKILSDIKKILGVSEKYYLESDFIKLDCLGFDIQDKNISLKVYELLDLEKNKQKIIEHIPQDIDYWEVKEYGVLKDLFGRKKYFFRLHGNYDISILEKKIPTDLLQNFQSILTIYTIGGKLKYYCKEAEREEIYFV